MANADLVASAEYEIHFEGKAPGAVRVRNSALTSGTWTVAGRAVFAPGPVGTQGAAITNGAPLNAAGSNIGQTIMFVDSSTAATGRAPRASASGLLVDGSGATQPVAGDVASGATNTGNPLQAGGRAATALPTAVANNQRVGAMFDKFGRLVVLTTGTRDLETHATQTLTTTTQTTILTAVASTFLDLTAAWCTNLTATASSVTWKDSTSGTTQFIMSCPAVIGPCEGSVTGNLPVNQSAVNNNWTLTLGTAVGGSGIACFAQAVKNQ